MFSPSLQNQVIITSSKSITIQNASYSKRGIGTITGLVNGEQTDRDE
jgi:hypothetical protein